MAHCVPNCRIVGRLLEVIPWHKQDEIQVVLSIDKGLMSRPDDLRKAMHEAADLATDMIIKDAYAAPKWLH